MHSGCHIDSDVYKSHNKSKSIYWDLFCNLFKSHFSSLDEPSKMQEICTVSPTNSQILTSVQRSNFRYCIYKRHSYVYSQIFLNRNRFFFFFFQETQRTKLIEEQKSFFSQCETPHAASYSVMMQVIPLFSLRQIQVQGDADADSPDSFSLFSAVLHACWPLTGEHNEV